MSSGRHILTLSCVNRPGIVAKVATALFDGSFNILDAQQFDDVETGDFFMRVVFNAAAQDADIKGLRDQFRAIATAFGMTWSMRPADQLKRVVLMVSRFDHCLVDLLYRWRSGELRMDPVAIIANYPRDTYAHIDFGDIPFHFLATTGKPRWSRKLTPGKSSGRPRPISSSSRATCKFCRTGSPPSSRGAASTSTTPSCLDSRARSPITRRMRAASN